MKTTTTPTPATPTLTTLRAGKVIGRYLPRLAADT
jgi:hypothetical protein